MNSVIKYIKRSIINIKKGKKDKGLDKQNKESEFEYLKNLIDENKKYQARLLDICEDLCRYKDKRCYKDNYLELSFEHKIINASWIHLPFINSFISTQGPLANTFYDFLAMCFDYDINLIIMLCNSEENGKEKCVKYWEYPNEIQNGLYGCCCNLKDFLRENYTEEKINDDITIRTFIIKDQTKGREKKVKQIHYQNWFTKRILDIENSYKNILFLFNVVDYEIRNRPIVVHCDSGSGRTGTFIALYNLFFDIRNQIQDKNVGKITFSIMNLVRKMKEMRIKSVEKKEEYEYIYEYIRKLLKDRN